MRYDLEMVKVSGVKEVVATTTTEEIRELNTKALRALHDSICLIPGICFVCLKPPKINVGKVFLGFLYTCILLNGFSLYTWL